MRDYIAFISYRHTDEDSLVSEMLHRRIEHYRIPKDIKTDRKDRRLGYVFRDREELPATSHLPPLICDALDRSRYLIVVTSPDTKESLWVIKEITYFLKYHDRSHVLVMNARSNPKENMPDILLKERDKHGRILQRFDPSAANLECKWYEKPTIFWKESLRILAAIIGCPYDSLYQRERRYLLRRIFVFILVCLAIIGSLLGMYNAMQRKNDELLLRSATTAEATLKAGDVPLALDMAVDTLSKCEGRADKPRFLAEQVLNDALMPYSLYTPHVAAIITQPEDIETFRLSRDEKTVLTMDRYGGVSAYDLDSAGLLWQQKPSNSGTDACLFVTKRAAIVKKSDSIRAWKLADGELLWEIEATIQNTMLSNSGEVMACVLKDEARQVLRFIDTSSGDTIGEIIPEDEGFAGGNQLEGFPKDWCALGVFDDADEYFYGYDYSEKRIRFCKIALSDMSVKGIWSVDMGSEKRPLRDEILCMRYLDAEDRLMVVRKPSYSEVVLWAETIDTRSESGDIRRVALRMDASWYERRKSAPSYFDLGEHYFYGLVDQYMFVIDMDSDGWDTHVFDTGIIAFRIDPEHSDFFTVVTKEGEYRTGWVEDTRIKDTYGDKLDVPVLCAAEQCAVLGEGIIELASAKLDGIKNIVSHLRDSRVLCVPKVSRNSLWVYELKARKDVSKTLDRRAYPPVVPVGSTIEGIRHTASFEDRKLTVNRAGKSGALWSRPVSYLKDRLRQAIFLADDRYFAVVTLDNRVTIYDVASGEVLFYGTFPLVKDSKDGMKAERIGAEIAMAFNSDGTRLFIYAKDGYGDGICVDTRTWTRVATIADMFDYDPDRGVICVMNTDYEVFEFHELDAHSLVETVKAIQRDQSAVLQ